jgi:hypothetical protein
MQKINMKKTKLIIIASLVTALLLKNYGFLNSTHASDQEFAFRVIGRIPTEGVACDVHVVGDTVYILDFEEGFLIYDVSEPANPTLLGSYEVNNDPKGGHNFLIRGDYAIVGFMGAGLKIINISDPANLRIVGEYHGGGLHYITVADDLVYLAMGTDGIKIIDISDVTQPIKVGEFNNGNSLYHTVVFENTAYIKDGDQDKTLGVDVTNPSNITEIGIFDWTAFDIEMVDNIGYISSPDEGVLIYDFSDPTEPFFLDEHNDGDGGVTDIDIIGNLAFVASGSDGLEILDITYPESPVEIAQFNDGSTARNLFVEGNVAYIAEYDDGVGIILMQGFDLITTTTPTLTSTSTLMITTETTTESESSPSFEVYFVLLLFIISKKYKKKRR